MVIPNVKVQILEIYQKFSDYKIVPNINIFQACDCNSEGRKTKDCNLENGDCDCKENICGPKCDKCCKGYYGFPDCKSKSLKKILMLSFFRINK